MNADVNNGKEIILNRFTWVDKRPWHDVFAGMDTYYLFDTQTLSLTQFKGKYPANGVSDFVQEEGHLVDSEIILGGLSTKGLIFYRTKNAEHQRLDFFCVIDGVTYELANEKFNPGAPYRLEHKSGRFVSWLFVMRNEPNASPLKSIKYLTPWWRSGTAELPECRDVLKFISDQISSGYLLYFPDAKMYNPFFEDKPKND